MSFKDEGERSRRVRRTWGPAPAAAGWTWGPVRQDSCSLLTGDPVRAGRGGRGGPLYGALQTEMGVVETVSQQCDCPEHLPSVVMANAVISVNESDRQTRKKCHEQAWQRARILREGTPTTPPRGGRAANEQEGPPVPCPPVPSAGKAWRCAPGSPRRWVRQDGGSKGRRQRRRGEGSGQQGARSRPLRLKVNATRWMTQEAHLRRRCLSVRLVHSGFIHNGPISRRRKLNTWC